MTARTDANDYETEEIIDLVTGEQARTILAAASDGARSAEELAEACDVSLPTVYRQVNRLQECGFLDDNLRVERSGDHRKEFETMLERLCLTFEDGAVDASVRLKRDFVDKFGALWRDLERSGREFGW